MRLLRRLFGRNGSKRECPSTQPVVVDTDKAGQLPDLNPEARSKLDEIHSSREMFSYLRGVLVPELIEWSDAASGGGSLREILGAVDARMKSLTEEKNPCGQPVDCAGLEELRGERDELVERIERLHARYMDAHIESDKELSLNQKIQDLDRTVKEQTVQMDLLEKKAWALTPYVTMARKLKARNVLLRSKAEHLHRLLRALTAEHPQQKELASTLDNLAQENRTLRMELERKSELLSKLRQYLPPEISQMLDEVSRSNANLQFSLKEQGCWKTGEAARTEENLLDYMENLSEENSRLRRVSEANCCFDEFLKSDGKGDPGPVIAALKRDRQEVNLYLNARKEGIEPSTPAGDLRRAYRDLREEYRHVFVESRCKEHLYLQEQDEKKLLQVQARERTNLIQENRRLLMELNSVNRQWAELLRESEQKVAAEKKENAKLRSRCEELVTENADLARERSRSKKEHGEILLQLEGIFNSKRNA